MMRYRAYPATGEQLSVLGFGAMGFAGWFGAIDEAQAVNSLHAALELGINVIDTARAYGQSETVVGSALRQWGSQDVAWALRLSTAGVPVELHVHAGANHAFDIYAPDAAVTQRAMADRIRVLHAP